MRDLTHATLAVNSADQRRFPLMESLREIWEYRLLIYELARRDLKLRYKNSIGGVLWSLLNPLMQIGVLTILMKFILVNPVKSYSAYLFVLFLWNFIQTAVLDGCVSILTNANLVRKIYFPRAILPLVTLLGNLFHFGVAFVFTILYFFVLGTYPSQLRPDFLLVIPIMLCSFVLCLGVTFILAYLNVLYEDVRFIVTALLGVFFYALPIIYPIERVYAHPQIYKLYMLNPVATLLVMYQRALLAPPEVIGNHNVPLPTPPMPWNYFAITCGVSVFLLIVGFALFERYKWEIAERL